MVPARPDGSPGQHASGGGPCPGNGVKTATARPRRYPTKLSTTTEWKDAVRALLPAMPDAGTPLPSAVDAAIAFAVQTSDLTDIDGARHRSTWVQLASKFTRPGERVLAVLHFPKFGLTMPATWVVVLDDAFAVKAGGERYRLEGAQARTTWHGATGSAPELEAGCTAWFHGSLIPYWGGGASWHIDLLMFALVAQDVLKEPKPATSRPRTRAAKKAKPSPVLIRSAHDAELAAARWMTYWGCQDARATPVGADAGIDVEAASEVAQVKAEARPVGRPAVQQHHGVAVALGKTPLVFGLAGFTPQAMEYADQNALLLFSFDLQGEPEPANTHAARWVAQRT